MSRAPSTGAKVTGGNTKPDSKKGAPRLSTVWYTNAKLGPIWKDEDFEKPSRLCIPVGEEETTKCAA